MRSVRGGRPARSSSRGWRQPLGIEVEAAAHAVLHSISERAMRSAPIKDITINDGVRPARFADRGRRWRRRGMTIGRIAEELGCRRVLVPRTAGTLSACGGLFSDVVTEFSISQRADSNSVNQAAVNRGLAQLGEQIDEFFGRLDIPASLRSREFFVEARYPYQVWELEVPLAAGQFVSASDVEVMVEAFHRVHERVFAVSEPGQYIECIYWKGRATAHLRKPELTRMALDGAEPPTPATVRPAWFGALGALQTGCFRAEALHPGHRLIGPAIILEPTTTVVVYPGWLASVTETGDYLLTRTEVTT